MTAYLSFVERRCIPSSVVRSQYTNPRYIVRDDAVYLVSRFQYNNDVGGAIIEKIDLATGQPGWKTVFDLRTQDIREYALNIEIEDNRLVLYCIYLNEDNGHLATMIGNGLGFLSRKEYDIDTGLLVQQTTPDTTANDMVLLRSPLYDSELHFLSDTSIQVVRLGRKFESGSFLVIDTMDMDGVRLTPTFTLAHELYLSMVLGLICLRKTPSLVRYIVLTILNQTLKDLKRGQVSC